MNDLANPNHIFYHAECADGYTAAFIAARALPGVSILHPMKYNAPVEHVDLAGCVVYILDFFFEDLEILEQIIGVASSITILDHHESAMEKWLAHPELHAKINAVFDMEHCGARLAWDYFATSLGNVAFLERLGFEQHLEDDTHRTLVDYVEDRDLWKWQLPNSKEISAVIAATPHNIGEWLSLLHDLAYTPDAVTGQGRLLLTAQAIRIEKVLTRAVQGGFAGFPAAMVNASCDHSEVGHAMLEKWPEVDVALVYSDDLKLGKKVCSLRSRKGGVDCSKLAEARGGGGHPNAAGFTYGLGAVFP